jgi:hypothetical protein
MALNEAEITALTRAFESKIRTAAAVGIKDGSQHEINIVVHVTGTLSRRDTPAPAAPSGNIPWMAATAAIITRLGAHKEFSTEWLVDVIADAAKATKKERDALLNEPRAKETFEKLKGRVNKAVPFRHKRGALQSSFEVKVLECAAIRIAASETDGV